MKTTFSFYRVAVIGCGFIGVKYIQTFFSIPSITLQTICDSNLALLTGLKEQFNVKKTESNWQKVVSADDIDIVCICVPTNMHYTIASEAIKYGKSIICEKPLGHSFKESLLLSKMAHDNCINAICSYSLIFAPAIQYIKKIINSFN